MFDNMTSSDHALALIVLISLTAFVAVQITNAVARVRVARHTGSPRAQADTDELDDDRS